MATKASETANRTASTAKDAAESAENWAKAAKSDAETDLSAQIDVLRRDFGRLSDTISNLVQTQAHDVSGRVRETVDHARGQFNNSVNEASARGREMADRAQRQVTSATHEFEATVERNPMTSVLVALGVGFLAGLISRHR